MDIKKIQEETEKAKVAQTKRKEKETRKEIKATAKRGFHTISFYVYRDEERVILEKLKSEGFKVK